MRNFFLDMQRVRRPNLDTKKADEDKVRISAAPMYSDLTFVEPSIGGKSGHKRFDERFGDRITVPFTSSNSSRDSKSLRAITRFESTARDQVN